MHDIQVLGDGLQKNSRQCQDGLFIAAWSPSIARVGIISTVVASKFLQRKGIETLELTLFKSPHTDYSRTAKAIDLIDHANLYLHVSDKISKHLSYESLLPLPSSLSPPLAKPYTLAAPIYRTASTPRDGIRLEAITISTVKRVGGVGRGG